MPADDFPSKTALTRRKMLITGSALGLSTVAGCAAIGGSSRGVTDVVLHNNTEEQRTVDVKVIARNSKTPSIQTRLELAPGETHEINNKVVMNNDYDVTVSVAGPEIESEPYEETQEWSDAGNPLHILLTEQVVFAVQIG